MSAFARVEDVPTAAAYLHLLYACLEARLKVMYAYYHPGSPCERDMRSHLDAIEWYDTAVLRRAIALVRSAEAARRDAMLAEETRADAAPETDAVGATGKQTRTRDKKSNKNKEPVGAPAAAPTAVPAQQLPDDELEFWAKFADSEQAHQVREHFDASTDWVLRPEHPVARELPCPDAATVSDSADRVLQERLAGLRLGHARVSVDPRAIEAETWEVHYAPLRQFIAAALNGDTEARWQLCGMTMEQVELQDHSKPIFVNTRNALLLRRGDLILMGFWHPSDESAYNRRTYHLSANINFSIACSPPVAPHWPYGPYPHQGNAFVFPATAAGIAKARECWHTALDTFDATDLRVHRNTLRDIVTGTGVSASWRMDVKDGRPQADEFGVPAISHFPLTDAIRTRVLRYIPTLDLNLFDKSGERVTNPRVPFQTHRWLDESYASSKRRDRLLPGRDASRHRGPKK